jgi:ABC-type transport system involved in cytochrome c biogenesis permease subunit
MMTGWNIFPMMAAVVVLLSTVGAFFALRSRERSPWAMGFAILSVAVMALFIGLLWYTLERPPLRTMGETRLWYSFFILVAGLATYARWRYRWIMLFSTILATVFIIINIAKPEIHDQSLMPALQSLWFVPHVSIYMFSYALLGCATLLAVASLLKPRLELDGAI